jgi:hypothetical protein
MSWPPATPRKAAAARPCAGRRRAYSIPISADGGRRPTAAPSRSGLWFGAGISAFHIRLTATLAVSECRREGPASGALGSDPVRYAASECASTPRRDNIAPRRQIQWALSDEPTPAHTPACRMMERRPGRGRDSPSLTHTQTRSSALEALASLESAVVAIEAPDH